MSYLVSFVVFAFALLILKQGIAKYLKILEDTKPLHLEYKDKQITRANGDQFNVTDSTQSQQALDNETC